MTTVVNRRTHKSTLNDVYIGRPSRWGNQFVIGKDGSRADVVKKYERGCSNSPTCWWNFQAFAVRHWFASARLLLVTAMFSNGFVTQSKTSKLVTRY